MSQKMLIDATHTEETRVAIVDGQKLETFEYESTIRKQLKGSIFLAKVTRVEPSLQAAFVNYGGNRHGFLPFSEIHPDYFRIPIADREALLAEQEEEMAAREQEEEEAEAAEENSNTDHQSSDEDDSEDESESDPDEETSSNEGENTSENEKTKRRGRGGRSRDHRSNANSRRSEKYDDGDIEGVKPRRASRRNNYRIQEVIKRGQIMLIQVSKEERGNKGAAVTSYLSLPGRYSVLMPNSPRSGGVSRKIATHKDRKRMRDVLGDLDVPKGMSVILRTAGVERTKVEIKRDLDYLMRLWDRIRSLTLESTAPACVYEEGNLIKRAMRDIYSKEIDEVHVSGDDGYKLARDFMKMLMPSHVKKIQQYKDEKVPLFQRYQVEGQINAIGETTVTLKSGGYLVINPTEALVSVDVNSGRATKERHIEETALKTNLEAATEVARQLRLRDLGGLVVIDFIDMEDRRNNRKVEKKLKEAISSDRARTQVGRISSFGLLELSRQRLNPSLTEAQFEKCPHCESTGFIRSVDNVAVMILRGIEEEGVKGSNKIITVALAPDVAIYLLNQKRSMLATSEDRYNLKVLFDVQDDLRRADWSLSVKKAEGDDEDATDDAGDQDSTESNIKSDQQQQQRSNNNNRNRNRRGNRGGRGRNNNKRDQQNNDTENAADTAETNVSEATPEQTEEKEKPAAKRTRKAPVKKDEKPEEAVKAEKVEDDKPKKKTTTRKKAPAKKETEDKKSEAVTPPANDDSNSDSEPKTKKKGWWNTLIE